MWLLDRFSNPLWYRVSRLDKSRRRTVATALCAYDFLRQQVEKKLAGPAMAFIRGTHQASKTGDAELSAGLRTQLADEALLGLLWSCTCPAFDPGLRLPRGLVVRLPEIWGSFALADVNHRLNGSGPASLDRTGYSENPEKARVQVLSRWGEILGVADTEFTVQTNAGGFAEAWDWLARMFIADTLDGMAAIPDRILFAQARRLAAATPPHRAEPVERLMEQVAGAPEHREDGSK